MTTYIGIDPGANGSMVVLSEDIVCCSKKFGALTERDIWNFLQGNSDNDSVVLIERVGPNRGDGKRRQGASSMFTFGQNYGFLRGIITASGLRWSEVMATKWQPEFGLSTRKGETTTEKKNRHKAKAQQLFPSVNVTHSNADSLLIATYCKRMESLIF